MIPHDSGLPEPTGQAPPTQPREGQPIAGRIDSPLPKRLPATTPASTAPGLSTTPDLFSLLQSLRRRWISATMLGGMLGAIAAIGVWCLLTPKSTAFSKLKISAIQVKYLGPPNPGLQDFKTYMQTAADSIMSRRVIRAALQRPEVKKLGLSPEEMDPLLIEVDLKTEFKENNEWLTLQYSHNDPNVALAITNAIKDVYYDDVVDDEQKSRTKRITELEKVYSGKVEALQKKKESLTATAKRVGAQDPAAWNVQLMMTENAIRDARTQQGQIGLKLLEARNNLEVLDTRIAMRKESTGSTKPKDPKELLADALEDALDQDREAVELRTRISRLEAEIEMLIDLGYNPKEYITIVADRQKIEVYRKQLDKRKDALAKKVNRIKPSMVPGVNDDPALVRDQLVKQVKALTELYESWQQEVKTQTEKATKGPVWQNEYEQRKAEILADEKIVAEIRTNLDQEKVELEAPSRIAPPFPADLMKKDIKKQVLATAVAPLAVIFGVCMTLAWMESRKRRVRTAGEISRGLGIRVVGAVPRMKSLERYMAGEAELDLAGTPVMESIDAIRTRLLHESDAHSTRLVMVTSATAGEGKTTLAGHLACSLARAGRKTLLLDGDLRQPSVHELFELPLQPGFSEVLLGEVEVAEAARETHQENLSVIPAGQWDREVLLALGRDGLEGIFDKLVDEFDFIIIDSHPVLAATDSLLLGRQVDAVILSVLGEVSQMPRVFAAQQQIAGLGIRVLGAVVNGTDPEEVFTAQAATASAA